MPPLTQSAFKTFQTNFSLFYQPIYFYLWIISLLILPLCFEILQRILKIFKIHADSHQFLRLILTPIFAYLFSLAVIYFNYLNFGQLSKYKLGYMHEIIFYNFLEIVFKFRKNLWPSSYLHAGAFTTQNHYINLKSFDQVQTPKLLDQIQVFGQKYGCHACGTKLRFPRLMSKFKKVDFASEIFIGDHNPPRAIVRDLILPDKNWQSKNEKILKHPKLLPQCNLCSLKQASNVRAVLKDYADKDKNLRKNPLQMVKEIRTHGLDHFYLLLPWAFIINFIYEFYY